MGSQRVGHDLETEQQQKRPKHAYLQCNTNNILFISDTKQ